MFVTISIYHVRAGEEDAIIALYEDWQRHQQPKARGYLSGELLRNIDDPRAFLAIMRFESMEAARALSNDAEQSAWFQRVVSLNDVPPLVHEYGSEWP
jgi:heme-degrading monooxygenase HmoA